MVETFEALDPPPRLLMGPGPINADPRVLRAMAMPLLGQFDPMFTGYMNELMVLLRQLYRTQNHWSFLINGTARAGIEALLTSVISPGDGVLVPVAGRFGQLLCEIAQRSGAKVHAIETEWGGVFEPDQIEDAMKRFKPRLLAMIHGDTSTTMAQRLDKLGEICRRHDALLYVDATATLGGMNVPVDDWGLDAVSGGLQKCLSGPPGSSPITFNDRIAELVGRRKHIERGIRPDGFNPGEGALIQSNYFDLPMLMDYWSESRLNHHTEATSMLYAARECVRIVLNDGLEERFARHELTSRAMVDGVRAMGLQPFGDIPNKMHNITGIVIPDGVNGDAVIHDMLHNFAIEIGTSFGPLKGKIWRIGAMGYNCRKDAVLTTLAAFEATLRLRGYSAPPGAGVDAALKVYNSA